MNAEHKRRCQSEITRDAIFLLQVRRFNLLSTDIDGLESVDSETLDVVDYAEIPDWVIPFVENRVVDEDDAECEPGYVSINPQFLSAACEAEDSDGKSVCISWWDTESVWLDRDEATSWAKRHDYRFPNGWRVYSVCAEGELAKRLREFPELQQ